MMQATTLAIIEAMHKEAVKTLSEYLAKVGHDAERWSEEEIERVFFLTMQVKAARGAMARVALRDGGYVTRN